MRESWPRPNRIRNALSWCLGAAVVAVAAGGGTAWYMKSRNAAPAPTPAEPVVEARAVNLPRMQLQAQYAAPLMHTLIQRLRDPIDGTVCYLYLPIAVHHASPNATGYVEYGANSIGSISCLAHNDVRGGAAGPAPSP